MGKYFDAYSQPILGYMAIIFSAFTLCACFLSVRNICFIDFTALRFAARRNQRYDELCWHDDDVKAVIIASKFMSSSDCRTLRMIGVKLGLASIPLPLCAQALTVLAHTMLKLLLFLQRLWGPAICFAAFLLWCFNSIAQEAENDINYAIEQAQETSHATQQLR